MGVFDISMHPVHVLFTAPYGKQGHMCRAYVNSNSGEVPNAKCEWLISTDDNADAPNLHLPAYRGTSCNDCLMYMLCMWV